MGMMDPTKTKNKDVEPSVKVTHGKGTGNNGLENKRELPVIWLWHQSL